MVRADCLPEKVRRNVARIVGHGLRHLGQRQHEVGMALLLEELEREGDVLGRQRRAVMEARFRPQREVEACCGRRTG